MDKIKINDAKERKTMKNKFLPILLMIWPYLYFVNLLIPTDTIPDISEKFTYFYLVLTVVIYGLNIWNAFYCNRKSALEKVAFWNMIIKLVHIPFYIIVCFVGALSLLLAVVIAIGAIAPFVIVMLAVVDYILMLTSSMYGIHVVRSLRKQKVTSKIVAILYVVSHLIFVADVISAIVLYVHVKRIYEIKRIETVATETSEGIIQ